ncbi:MAG: hypothetical protein JXB85_03310, partial [Anaerolineales bacterium]|nr:hypothetical protein [Anaerolineales bacterium]
MPRTNHRLGKWIALFWLVNILCAGGIAIAWWGRSVLAASATQDILLPTLAETFPPALPPVNTPFLPGEGQDAPTPRPPATTTFTPAP